MDHLELVAIAAARKQEASDRYAECLFAALKDHPVAVVALAAGTSRQAIYQLAKRHGQTIAPPPAKPKGERKPREKALALTYAAVAHAKARGILVPGPCEVCGTTTDIHAHHDDYTKRLEVRWLCGEHHRELHNEWREQGRKALRPS